MNPSRSSICRVAAALGAALLCTAMPATRASAAAGGADGGEIGGTFAYTQAPPTAPPGCGAASWTLNASGAAVAAQAGLDTSSGAFGSFAFAGTTTVSGSGSSACANAAEDLFGTLSSLSIVSTGSAGTLSCQGSGNYVRAGLVFFAELGMDCTLNNQDLGINLVTISGALVPSSAALTQFAFEGAYLFDLSNATS